MDIEKLIDDVKKNNSETSLEEITKRFRKMAYHISNMYANSVKSYLDVEDYANMCLLEIPNAIKKYDPDSKGKFSTFVYVAMRNKMLKTIRFYRAKKRDFGNQIFLEHKYGSSEFTYECIVEGGVYLKNDKQLTAESETFLKMSLNDGEIELYKLYLDGLKLDEISEKTNLTKPQISRKLKETRKKIKKSKDIYKSIKN